MKTLVTQFLRGAGLTAALLLPLLALAQAPAQEATIRKNLVERLPGLPKIDEIRRTPMNGLFEVRVGTDLFYTDAQGNFLIQGNLIDTRQRRNLASGHAPHLLARRRQARRAHTQHPAFGALRFRDVFAAQPDLARLRPVRARNKACERFTPGIRQPHDTRRSTSSNLERNTPQQHPAASTTRDILQQQHRAYRRVSSPVMLTPVCRQHSRPTRIIP